MDKLWCPFSRSENWILGCQKICQYLQNLWKTHKAHKSSTSSQILAWGAHVALLLSRIQSNQQKHSEANTRLPIKMLCQFLQIMRENPKKRKTSNQLQVNFELTSIWLHIDFESTLNRLWKNISSILNQIELILLNQKSNWKRFDLAAVTVLYMA